MQVFIHNNKSKKTYPEYATHGQLILFLLHQTRPHNTHAQTQRKEKGDFPFVSSRQARSFGPYRGKNGARFGCRAHSVVEQLLAPSAFTLFSLQLPAHTLGQLRRTALSKGPQPHSLLRVHTHRHGLSPRHVRSRPRLALFFRPLPLLGVPSLSWPIGRTRHPSPCLSLLRKQADTEPSQQRSARAFWRENLAAATPRLHPSLRRSCPHGAVGCGWW